jgi:hypothetical protein
MSLTHVTAVRVFDRMAGAAVSGEKQPPETNIVKTAGYVQSLVTREFIDATRSKWPFVRQRRDTTRFVTG